MLAKKIFALLTVCTMLVGFLPTYVQAAVTVNAYPTITTAAKEITNESAVISGRAYVTPEENTIEWGIAFSTTSKSTSPTYAYADSERFTLTLTGLRPNRTYYYRVFIRYYDSKDKEQIAYSAERSFTTKTASSSTKATPGECTVNVPRITTVSGTEVLAESSYVANGNIVKYAGFIYSSTNSNPTRSSSGLYDLYDQTNEEENLTFSKNFKGLTKDTTYYVRSYVSIYSATSALVDVYSPVVSFTSSIGAEPEVFTELISNVNISGADIEIDVVSGGNSKIVERGVVYSTSNKEPELYSSSSKYQTVLGTVGVVIVTLADLNPNVTYYVRAYARNAEGVYYGDVKKFTTKNEINVTTLPVTSVASSTAVANGTVEDVSSLLQLEKGFVYSKESKMPTLNDETVAATGNKSGNYSLTLPRLELSTPYYVRAYAKTINGISYGETVMFSTTGYAMTLNITYKTANGTYIGGENLQTSFGAILAVKDLKLPINYKTFDRNWTYNVGTAPSIDVIVTEDYGNDNAFMEGVGGYAFAPDQATTRAEVAKIIFSLKRTETNAPRMTFSDVPESHAAKSAIDYVSSMGYMQGYPDGTFKPNNPITRAEVCVVLSMVYNLQGSASVNVFSDVRPSDWYYQYVALAYSSKIFSGYPDGTFLPANTTTRAEICTIFVNSEKRSTTPLGTINFTDVPNTHWAYKYIMSAAVPRP